MDDKMLFRMKKMGNQRALVLNEHTFLYSDLVERSEKIAKKIMESSFSKNELYRIAINRGIDSIDALLAIIHLEGKCMFVDQSVDIPLIQKEINVPTTINELPSDTIGACFLVKSSGSTGNAKWLWRSETSWKRAYTLHRDIFKCKPGSTFWIDGSLSYTGNLHTVLATWWNGGCVYWTTNQSIRSAYADVVNEGVESWFLLPSKLETLSQFFQRKLGDVKQPMQIITVGEPFREATYERLKQRLPKTIIRMYYGSAELGHVSLKTISESKWIHHHVGKPFDHVNVIICNRQIYVSSPYTCFDDLNYYTSGDLGRFEEDQLYMMGREATQINRRGVKIHLDEILDQVLSNEWIDGAAIRIKRVKEKTTYELLLKGTPSKTIENQIIEAIPENMRPSSIVYVDVLPHNENGKQLRVILDRGR